MVNKRLKWLCLGLSICLLLTYGCGSKENSAGSEEAPSPTVTTPVDETTPTSEPLNNDSGEKNIMATYNINTDTLHLTKESNISENLFGIFLEDINFAVDGGMYTEMIKNRSFEYGSRASGTNKHGWTVINMATLSFEVIDGSSDSSCLNHNNTHYAKLQNNSNEINGILNTGYLDGMSFTIGTALKVSAYLKADNYSGQVRIRLTDKDKEYGVVVFDGITNEWKKYEGIITPSYDGIVNGTLIDKNVKVSLEIENGTIYADMVSVMTTDTYKNTLVKRSIGEMLEALEPAFMRFPGGCVIEGSDEESMYRWKDSIGNGETFTVNGQPSVGDMAIRPQGRSLWNGNSTNPYYTTYGIGFYEYFVFCEALNCMPVPVLNAGMTCQIQSPKYIVYGINSDEFKQCIQDALDLVEFCRGDASTKWGKVRIDMGHAEPFELKYIAIGNEQWQSEYFQHYELFEEAFDKAAKQNPEMYGNIRLIVANSTDSASRVGWSYVEDNENERTGLVDEHYYESPSFFYTHTSRYDSYSRNLVAKVFLGEYAARSNTMDAALAEAAYMTGLEKNGDVVEMACYAPLFASTSNQWTPDMIWFTKSQVYGSVNYYVQKLFSTNSGTKLLDTELSFENLEVSSGLSGKVGLGSWQSSVAYDNIKVTSNKTGEILYSTNFDNDSTLTTDNWKIHKGTWAIKDGQLTQSNIGAPADGNTGDVIYVGDEHWTNYTLECDATLTGGLEGFLIPICVKDASNNIFWNLGGWNNTVSCLQEVSGGSKSGQLSGTVQSARIKKNEVYRLKVVVEDNTIKCYMNDKQMVDYIVPTGEPLYESAVIDKNGDIIIKLINATDTAVPVTIKLDNFNSAEYDTTAVIDVMSADSKSVMNTKSEPEKCIPVSGQISISNSFLYDAPTYSLTVIRIKKK